MFAACPQCGFLVAAQAGGTARCPRCGSPIETSQSRTTGAAASQDRARSQEKARGRRARGGANSNEGSSLEHPPVEPPIDEGSGSAFAEKIAEPEGDGASDAAARFAPPATDDPSRRVRRTPSFVRRHAPAAVRPHRRWEWMALLSLAALLALQMVLVQREAVAASARWRPLVVGLCGVFPCDVPPWREPAAFTMLQRSVQPLPDRAGVLHVSASFRNDARWPQPWPTVLLTLSDMEGRRVGQRAFRPDEYLRGASGSEGSGPAGPGQIAPGQAATIQLAVVEPPERVVAFTFDFL